MTQRIIVPTHYDVEIKILFDPRTGATEMLVRNAGTVPVSMLKVAGLVSEHSAALIKQLVTGEIQKTMQQVVATDAEEKGTPNA
jgi:hypothetical protein